MARIYTRKGDDGTTGLVGGARVPKDHPRVEAGGDLDELAAALGAARAFVARGEIQEALLGIQVNLIGIGARLADPRARRGADGSAAALERLIDRFEAKLPPIKGFILRGGTRGAAFLHLACTVCRRAERRLVSLSRREAVPSSVLRYVNRLSDLLFVMARIEDREER